MLRIFFLLLVPAVLANTVHVAGDLSAFNWFAGGVYTATGTYEVIVTATGAGPTRDLKPVATAQLCVSENSVTLSTNLYGTQNVGVDNYCYWDPLTDVACACNTAFNITDYQRNYAQVLRVAQTVRKDHRGNTTLASGWEGAVLDPGQRRAYSGVRISTNEETQLTAYSLSGTVLAEAAPGLFVVVKTTQMLTFTSIRAGLHNCPSLPAACANPSSYDDQFAPLNNPVTGLPEVYVLSV